MSHSSVIFWLKTVKFEMPFNNIYIYTDIDYGHLRTKCVRFIIFYLVALSHRHSEVNIYDNLPGKHVITFFSH